ncbi:MAG: DUF6382 domain-containing protein [Candidatus Cohnella colombiensis]|uniref:DUF6382 domain-containing protein n=1 Tax=Candidatus Cohnella colombiensis TaxID=3121368 RepID=A0AA95JG94_9BACL|nr:MAG: DUF6382 domain-containing protein [Cohnella sp.]
MRIEQDPPLLQQSLNRTQLQMLKDCEVLGMLPIELEEMNGNVSLRYCISDTRMLSEVLRTTKWSMSDMMVALYRVTEVIEESRIYMLDASRIKLEDEFIFVGRDWQELHFTYLPLLEVIDMPDLATQLERLVIRWMRFVTDLDGRAVQEVLQHISSKAFTPSLLRQYTRQYLITSSAGKGEGRVIDAVRARDPKVSITASEEPQLNINQQVAEQPHAKVKGGWSLIGPQSGDPHSASGFLGDPSSEAVLGSSAAVQEVTHTFGLPMDRWRVVVGSIAVILMAMIWKLIYLDAPNQQSMLICAGISLLTTAGAIVLWNGIPTRGKKTVKTMESNAYTNISHSFGGSGEWGEAESYSEIPRFQVHTSDEGKKSSVKAITNRSIQSDTTWLGVQVEQTALLDGTSNGQQQTSGSFLLWESKGDQCQIHLIEESLVIGRSSEAAHHVDESNGISRAHAEVRRIDNNWKVKDLGSRNGSKLNDQPMIPYEFYPLQSGDRLALANSCYRFMNVTNH